MRRQTISNSTGLDYWLVKKNRQKRRQGAAPMPGAKQAQPSLSSDMTMDDFPCRRGMPRLKRGREPLERRGQAAARMALGLCRCLSFGKMGGTGRGTLTIQAGRAPRAKGICSMPGAFWTAPVSPQCMRCAVKPAQLRAKALPPPRSQHRRQSRHPGHSLPPCSCCQTSPLP